MGGDNDIQDRRLDCIEKAIEALAMQNERAIRQDEKIINLQGQVAILFEKFDGIWGPAGTLNAIQRHQASCPKTQVKWLWGAIGSMALAIIVKFLEK
jgi:hypothetical protein